MSLKCRFGPHGWTKSFKEFVRDLKEKGLKCGFGLHDWTEDCQECASCDKTRNHPHEWSVACEKCKRCEQKNHKWTDVWARRCSVCGEPDWRRLFREVQREVLHASLGAIMSMGLSRLGAAKESGLSKEEYLRKALQPVADTWEISVETLLRVAKTRT